MFLKPRKGYKVTPEMSNRDTSLTKPQKSPQFVTPICQIIGFQSQSEVTAICQIMTPIWQVVTLIRQTKTIPVSIYCSEENRKEYE